MCVYVCAHTHAHAWGVGCTYVSIYLSVPIYKYTWLKYLWASQFTDKYNEKCGFLNQNVYPFVLGIV